jgi:hypothetical protein
MDSRRRQRCLRQDDGVRRAIEAFDHFGQILAGGSPASPALTLNPCHPAQRLKRCPRFHPAFPFANQRTIYFSADY